MILIYHGLRRPLVHYNISDSHDPFHYPRMPCIIIGSNTTEKGEEETAKPSNNAPPCQALNAVHQIIYRIKVKESPHLKLIAPLTIHY